MKKIIFLFLLIFFTSYLSRAVEKLTFYDASGSPLLEISDELIKNTSGRILYNIQGNIVFQGSSDKRKDILLMLKSDNIFSKMGGQVLGQMKNQTVYYTFGGGFYIRPSDKSTETQLLAYWQKNKDGSFSLFNGANDSLLAYYPFENPSDILLTALFHYYQVENGMAETLIANYTPPEENYDVSSTSGTIRRMWGGGNDEYEWDGYSLKRRWGNNPMQEWTFDGLVLRRVWSSTGNEEFIWQDNVLRRRWYNSPDEFTWNGRTFRRRYGPEVEEYIVQGSVVKSMWTSSDLNQWEIDGDIPIPIIIMVVYGLVNR